MCHILAQISWIYPYLLKIPGAAKTVKTARRLGREMAEKRKELGSNTHDLYHYLVSTQIVLSCIIRNPLRKIAR